MIAALRSGHGLVMTLAGVVLMTASLVWMTILLLGGMS